MLSTCCACWSSQLSGPYDQHVHGGRLLDPVWVVQGVTGVAFLCALQLVYIGLASGSGGWAGQHGKHVGACAEEGGHSSSARHMFMCFEQSWYKEG